ncbi:hypothetical protein L914_04661 [Phytophthora nicotianae]|uniref:Uncharacterized protein n=1 Tax=Phytophthora nicotianae TaxID=4792 RepID=W2NS99_PHYNI|nr:hypothetical protein L916_04668 [Phytophthora nicotianae]ETM51511.1 hypothetical protein L914_04661 [Phytophthora nicotianae]
MRELGYRLSIEKAHVLKADSKTYRMTLTVRTRFQVVARC